MWLLLAFCSTILLGLYDVAKKRALSDNAVLPVLLLNILFSTLIFSPAIASAEFSLGWFDGTIFDARGFGYDAHLKVFVKAAIVLTSWIFGYFAIKHLPLSLVGPINATRPVIVLVGAMLIFGERLNVWQWIGVVLAMVSIVMLSRSGRKEGINFKSNKWVWMLAGAAITGAASGLYDKHILKELTPIFVQGWYNIYQLILMSIIVSLLWLPNRKESTPFRWSWAIPCISITLSCADFTYFTALTDSDAMISIVSMVRRGSVVVSFLCATFILREKNIRSKAIDLLFIIVGMIFLYIGSR